MTGTTPGNDRKSPPPAPRSWLRLVLLIVIALGAFALGKALLRG